MSFVTLTNQDLVMTEWMRQWVFYLKVEYSFTGPILPYCDIFTFIPELMVDFDKSGKFHINIAS